ncbi:MAG: hypothetical protein HFJ24_03870 [Clostridia bacterium]|nr:hypothetical protein [Clostridia bacterium]MCI9275142.1 hypothetical protein [Clostridia bacterium]
MNLKERVRQEKGITLVALIITIIVLVILAAVTINAAFNSGIIETAVNGAVNYADAQNKEQVTFDDLDKNIQDIVKKIEEYNIGGSGTEQKDYGTSANGKLKFIKALVGKPVENTNDSISITALATDENENAELTYTLYIETTAKDANELVTAKAKQGVPVTLTKTGLENYTTYKYKVVVSNGETEATSLDGTASTYCKGEHCEGTVGVQIPCVACSQTGKVTCTVAGCTNGKISCDNCGGDGKIEVLDTCPDCNGNKERNCTSTPSVQVLDPEARPLPAGVCSNGCGKSAGDGIGWGIAVNCADCNFSYKSAYNLGFCSDNCKNEYAQKVHDEANNKVQCTTCSGTGKVSKTVTCGECTNGSNDCITCKGTGKVMHMVCSGNGYTIENNNCGHQGANGPHYYCAEHGTNVEEYHQ